MEFVFMFFIVICFFILIGYWVYEVNKFVDEVYFNFFMYVGFFGERVR